MYRRSILQPGGGDGQTLVVGNGFAIIGVRDAKSVDGEAGLTRYPLVQIARAALTIDARLGGEIGDLLAWVEGKHLSRHEM